MPTLKQKNLAKLSIENPKLQKKDLVELGGYGHSIQKTPAKVLDSKGYKESLAEYGLTEGLIAGALVDDINSKKGKRCSELTLGADILGMRKNSGDDDDSKSIKVDINIISAIQNVYGKSGD